MANTDLVSVLKSAISPRTEKSINTVPSSGGWMPWSVKEPFGGAWQQNVEWTRETVLAYHAVFSCMTLIASDMSKLQINLMRNVKDIWKKIPPGAFDVINKPNNYQNRIQFIEQWVISKLSRGNTYILLGRDSNGVVNRMYVLAPDRVLPLVTETGDVYYQLGQDNLTGINETGIIVPASEIIHDRFNCLFHPLVGLSPLFACGLAAYQGLKIQDNSAVFFGNMSRPSGILTAPGAITNDTALRLKEHWETNYTGASVGKVAVLGDDLKYQSLTINAVDSQMVEQLRLTAEIVCSTFHVPKYKVIGDPPSYNNIEALEQQYYSQCLQKLIEDIELCLDIGLGIPKDQGVEFDLDGLLRMDTKTQVETLAAAVKGGLDTPNEARKRRNQSPLDGGDTVYMQEQNYSLAALARRDAKEDPFAKDTQSAPVAASNTDDDAQERMIEFVNLINKGFNEVGNGLN